MPQIDKTGTRSVQQQPDVTKVASAGIETKTSAQSVAARPGVEIEFSPPAGPNELGTLGPYRVVRQLGQGGMGAVYLAIDTRLDRKLALKIMLPQYAADPAAKERFLREARAAAQVAHDNVVTVYEADERDGVTYIAMQLLQGYPLDEYLRKKGTPSVPQAIRLAREAAAGLAAAHRIGLVHRDVKPANLWLEAPKGRVKVLDFGLAKPLDAQIELTKSGVVLGTPAYMSPEQARGLPVDARTDLFSLGAVMYQLATGRLPFEGQTTMAVLMALGTDEPREVRDLNSAVPAPLAELIHQLLAKDPAKRPKAADEVVQRLRSIAEQIARPGSESPSAATSLSVTAAPDPFAGLDLTIAPSLPSGSRPATLDLQQHWIWIAAAAALVVVAIVGIIAGNMMGRANNGTVPSSAAASAPRQPTSAPAPPPPFAAKGPTPPVAPPPVEHSKDRGKSLDPALILEQARTHAALREWKDAAGIYAEIIDLPRPDWGEVAFEYAAVLLLTGDQAAYKKLCGLVVDRAGKWDVRGYHVGRICTLGADSFTPAERPAELAKKEMDYNNGASAHFWKWLQGAQHYRAGRYPEALSLLQQSRDDKDHPPDGVAGVRMWMALTYLALNQPEEARREFEQAEKWLANYAGGMPPEPERRQFGLHLHNWLEVHVLQREVAVLLQPGPMNGK